MVHYIWACNGEASGPQALEQQSSPGSRSSSSSSSEGRGPYHYYYYRKSLLGDLSPTGGFGSKSPERGGSGPIPRAICKNCAHVFLCAYSPAGADFCSIDCRTSFDLLIEEEQQDMDHNGAWAAEGRGAASYHDNNNHHHHYDNQQHGGANYHPAYNSNAMPPQTNPTAAAGGGGPELGSPQCGEGAVPQYAPAPRARPSKLWAPHAATPDQYYYESAQLPSSLTKSLSQRRGRSEWQQAGYF